MDNLTATLQFNAAVEMGRIAAQSECSRLVSLRWSSEPPTESGWYWLRSTPCEDANPNDNEDAEIVLVRGNTETCPKRVLSIDGNRSFLTSYTDRPGYVQWAGPVPFPIAN